MRIIGIRTILGRVFRPFIDYERKRVHDRMKENLKITSAPSIISSDCVGGGVISHNLGLRFCSPTVNLYFRKDDFILFLEHLREFLLSDLLEARDSSVTFPMGSLSYDGRSINVYFQHYETFREAKEKWDERKARVDLSNLVIIWLIHPFELTKRDIERFERLPYKRKMLITYENPTGSGNVVISRVFRSRDYYPGKILHYPSSVSFKTYLDEIDYVSLLNGEA